MPYKMKPTAIGARRASGFIEQQFKPEDRSSQETVQDLIRAELIGAAICTASDITVKSSTPLLGGRP